MVAKTDRVHLTVARIAKIEAPAGKQSRYVFDDDPRHLCVRVTPAGVKSFVFASKLAGVPLRVTIGSVNSWLLDAARIEAKRLQTLVDKGLDPRQERADRLAATEAKRVAAEAAQLDAKRRAASAMEAWKEYVAARRGKWGALSRRDHERVTQEGGEPITRGRKATADGKTQPGALRPLLERPLWQIDASCVEAWLKTEAARRPTHAALAFRLLRGFLRWCAEKPEYADQVDQKACAAKAVREELPKRAAKDDCLQREQLKAWFEKVRAIRNPVIAAYLQSCLLTGARREELAGLRWNDVDFQWRTIRIADKIDGERTIPLTPFVAALLRDLKQRNDIPPPSHRILHGKRIPVDLESWMPSPWVFASPTAAAGYLQEPRIQHKAACAEAGIEGLTIHGLRRSFGTLSEWVEAPTGVVAQIMGHKPSATAEKHYRRRPVDLLRQWHTRIETWILAEAGIKASVDGVEEMVLAVA